MHPCILLITLLASALTIDPIAVEPTPVQGPFQPASSPSFGPSENTSLKSDAFTSVESTESTRSSPTQTSETNTVSSQNSTSSESTNALSSNQSIGASALQSNASTLNSSAQQDNISIQQQPVLSANAAEDNQTSGTGVEPIENQTTTNQSEQFGTTTVETQDQNDFEEREIQVPLQNNQTQQNQQNRNSSQQEQQQINLTQIEASNQTETNETLVTTTVQEEVQNQTDGTEGQNLEFSGEGQLESPEVVILPTTEVAGPEPTTYLPNPTKGLTQAGQECLQKCRNLGGISCKNWDGDEITCCRFTGCQWPFYCNPASRIEVQGCINLP